MNIKTSITVKHKKKVISKKEKRDIVITDNDILSYFEYVATPYDLQYLCSHIYDTNLIKSWLQRIVIYNTTILDVKNGEVIKFDVSESDINNTVNIIKQLAIKREILLPRN